MASYSVDGKGYLVRKGAYMVSSNDSVGAINEAIKKWRAIHRHAVMEAKIVRRPGDCCALCVAFKDEKDRPFDPCQGCPVKELTGESDCHYTPFWKYPKFRVRPTMELVTRAERAAAAEILFLQAVRAFLTG